MAWKDVAEKLDHVSQFLRSDPKLVSRARTLGFTPYSGQLNQGLEETLVAAGFTKAHVVETSKGFCVLATKP